MNFNNPQQPRRYYGLADVNEFLKSMKLNTNDNCFVKTGKSQWHTKRQFGLAFRFGGYGPITSDANTLSYGQNITIELSQSSCGNLPIDFSQCQINLMLNGELIESQRLTEHPAKASLIAIFNKTKADLIANPNYQIQLSYAGFGADEGRTAPSMRYGGSGSLANVTPSSRESQRLLHSRASFQLVV